MARSTIGEALPEGSGVWRVTREQTALWGFLTRRWAWYTSARQAVGDLAQYTCVMVGVYRWVRNCEVE